MKRKKRLPFEPEMVEAMARWSIDERTLDPAVLEAAGAVAKQVVATLPETLAEKIALANAMGSRLAFETGAHAEVDALLTAHAVAVARAHGLKLLDHPYPVYPQAGWKPNYR
jgi:hypothetical protein